MSLRDHKELRASLRELARRLPPGAADWPYERVVRFKAAVKAAHIAADHPASVPWMLQSRMRDLRRFHEPVEA